MKKMLIAAIAAVAAFTPANAADIGSTKDVPAIYPVNTSVNWSGFYIGGQIGYGNANHNLTVVERHDAYCFDQFGGQLSGEGDNQVNTTTAPADSFNPVGFGTKTDVRGLPFAFNAEGTCTNSAGEGEIPTTGGIGAIDSVAVNGNSRDVANLDGLNSHGMIGGGTLGFDYARDRFLIGVFGSYDFASMKSSGNIGDVASFDVEKGDEWSVGARAGVIAGNRTLIYLLAAYTETDYDFSGRLGDDSASRTVDFTGVTVGGGIEYAATNNIFVGLQYTHTFFDEETVASEPNASGLPGHRFELRDDLDEDKIMFTVKAKGSLF